MGYREVFWREDVEAHLKFLQQDAKEKVKDTKPATLKRVDQKIKALNLDFKLKQQKLNKAIYEFIEISTKHLNEAQLKSFDNMRVAFGLIAEELIKSKDRTQLLTLAQLHNKGALDYLFEQIQTEKTNNNENSNEIIADGDHLNIPSVQKTNDNTTGNNTDAAE